MFEKAVRRMRRRPKYSKKPHIFSILVVLDTIQLINLGSIGWHLTLCCGVQLL
jgi:hypothetical protein